MSKRKDAYTNRKKETLHGKKPWERWLNGREQYKRKEKPIGKHVGKAALLSGASGRFVLLEFILR
jgi:hypothetical protein